MASRIASLLPRLSSFEISADRIHYVQEDEEEESQAATNASLWAVFDLIESPLPMKYLSLFWSFELVGIINFLPHLSELYVCLSADEVIKLLPFVPQLERISYVQSMAETTAELVGLLRALSSTKLAQTLSITMHWKDSFLFCLASRWDLVTVLECFRTSGITTKLSTHHVSELLRGYGSVTKWFQQALSLISEGHPLLPTKEELRDDASFVFQRAVNRMNPPCMRFFVTLFGPLRIDTFSVAASCLRKRFDAQRMQMLINLGLLRRKDLSSLGPDGQSLFEKLRDEQPIRWLLSSIPQADAHFLLRAAPLPCFAARQIAYLEDCSDLLFPSVFSFPHPIDFLTAAKSCMQFTMPLVFQKMIDNTGVENFSGAFQGQLLWNIFHDAVDVAIFLEMWLTVINTSSNPVQIYDAGRMSSTFSLPANTPRDLCVLHILKTFRVIVRDQAMSDVSNLPDMVTELGRWLILSCDNRFDDETDHFDEDEVQAIREKFYPDAFTRESICADVEIIVDELFIPLTKLCLAHRLSPRSDLMLTALFNSNCANNDEEELGYVGTIFDACAECTFPDSDPSNAPVVDLVSHRRFVEALLMSPLSNRDKCIRAVETWLPRIDVSALNDKYDSVDNAMDLVLLHNVAHYFLDSPSLIDALVKKGCRISRSDRKGRFFSARADPVAVELYFDATRMYGSN